ncbi:hypothetical protein BFP70_08175 [Thioclava sp. SK-1]|nr:hypothetical protein BFP70_08175 [Thioclava sp. SK-1]
MRFARRVVSRLSLYWRNATLIGRSDKAQVHDPRGLTHKPGAPPPARKSRARRGIEPLARAGGL